MSSQFPDGSIHGYAEIKKRWFSLDRIYKITNVKGGIVVDLSRSDGVSSESAVPFENAYINITSLFSLVIGYPDHSGPNQRVR